MLRERASDLTIAMAQSHMDSIMCIIINYSLNFFLLPTC